MSQYLIQGKTLTDIANAVREKNGTTEPIKVSELPTEIANIQAGGGDSQWEGYWLRTATEFAIPEGTTTVSDYFFQNFTSLASIELPNSIKSFGHYAFYRCTNLVLTELPSGTTSIGMLAFQTCRKLALTEIPSGITSIEMYAFENCTALTSITFKGKPNSIHSGAFNNCTNLTTINVPWAEGAVSGAPWGATNATINYNYVG